MKNNFLIIDTSAALTGLCKQLKGSSWLAVDTEFEREKTFYPELCLLQLANADIAAVIDPLAIEDLEPVLNLLYDTSILKVFHSARQDLEIFFDLKGAVPEPLFDTQLAAPLLGYAEQIGYANLVSQVLGVELSKTHTRADWKRRPLHDAQLRYAVDDVIYLAQVYEQILHKLTELDRLGWLLNEFSALADPALYRPDPENVWLKVRSANKLKGSKLSVFQHLVAWRESTARVENRPRKWLVRDEALLDMAQMLPDTEADLSRIKGVNKGIIRRHGSVILKIIQSSQHLIPKIAPRVKKSRTLTVNQEVNVDVLMAIVRLRAQENDMNPVILAPRKELEKFVCQQQGSVLLKGWREHLIGNELKAFLAGSIVVQVVDEQLSILSV